MQFGLLFGICGKKRALATRSRYPETELRRWVSAAISGNYVKSNAFNRHRVHLDRDSEISPRFRFGDLMIELMAVSSNFKSRNEIKVRFQVF